MAEPDYPGAVTHLLRHSCATHKQLHIKFEHILALLAVDMQPRCLTVVATYEQITQTVSHHVLDVFEFFISSRTH